MKRTRFLPEQDIERAALVLAERYCHRFSQPLTPHLPLEELIECVLELSFRVDDLTALFGTADILGATKVDERLILVDMSLDPCEHPEKEGRYRFTLAHEIGHWELHRQSVPTAAQRTLFDTDPLGTILCRASQYDQREWQANQYAAYLLMPASLIRMAWENCTGSVAPAMVPEAQLSTRRWGLGEESAPTLPVVRDMARVFHVSAQAMQIRLQGMGLLTTRAAMSGSLTTG